MKKNYQMILFILSLGVLLLLGILLGRSDKVFRSPSVSASISALVKDDAAPKQNCYACGTATRQDCPLSTFGSWWPDCQWNCEGRACTCVETSGCVAYP